MSYAEFVSRKLAHIAPAGIAKPGAMPASLFPHQASLTTWALKRGRAAIFADTGLGKSRMEVAWADAVRKETGLPVLILAPLAVAAQTAIEGQQLGISVTVCRDGADVDDRGINITNYDRLHRFNPSMFGGIVLDESSIIKHHDAKTFSTLTAAFKDTPYKLPATATPAPNDWTELGTHAEFLGICSRQEMLAEFFTHDGGDTSVWRLKGHARQLFWRWVVSWGALIRKPSDLGFDDAAYALPPLHLHEHQVEVDMPTNGMLFAMEAQTLSERRDARRMSITDRLNACIQEVHGSWVSQGLNIGALTTQPIESSGSQINGQATPDMRPSETQPTSDGASQRTQRKSARTTKRTTEKTSNDTVSAVLSSSCADTDLTSPRSLQCLSSNAAFVESVNATQNPDGCLTLTTTTQQAPSVDCSATLAICDSDGSKIGRLPADLIGKAEPWIIWVELNKEQDALEAAFGKLAFSIRGSDTADEKESRLTAWLAGERPVIISKPSILGWGINMQRCARMAFVGVTDSYEAYYQAVRRSWRFGQKREVHIHIFSSKAEGAVVANLKRKEREASQMAESLSAETRDAVMAEVTGSTRSTNVHNAARAVAVPQFLKAA